MHTCCEIGECAACPEVYSVYSMHVDETLSVMCDCDCHERALEHGADRNHEYGEYYNL